LLAAQKLGCIPNELVIFEDAQNGFAAGDDAGGFVIALATQLSLDEIGTRPWITDYSAVRYAEGRLLFG
jgi:beta-phosphoglucomutase-like phosphatase (HAD superfamily)